MNSALQADKTNVEHTLFIGLLTRVLDVKNIEVTMERFYHSGSPYYIYILFISVTDLASWM